MNETNELKISVSTIIPMSWRDELEKMARAEGKTISELLRELIDKALHGQRQAAQCYDDIARQVIRIIIELLQLYYMTENKS